MLGLSFFEQLDRVVAGSLDPEPVISSFLGGLEAMMADFEEAADEGSTSIVARLFDTVSERFHETHSLACDLLEEPPSQLGDLEKLRSCHGRLEQALLSFHEACWIERGPTGASWANQIVEGLESFLDGESLAPQLGALLDSLVLSCEKRGAARQAGPGRDLLLLLRPIADWARGSVTLTPAELQESVQRLPSVVVAAEEWMQEAEDRSLDRLLGLLDGKPSAEETLSLAYSTLAEVEHQLLEARLALSQSQGETAALIGDVEETLSELEHALRSLIGDVEGLWEWDFRDQLRDLRDHLAEHMDELEMISQTGDQESVIDLTVADAEAPEGENVRRLRLAVQAFSEGTLDASGLQVRVKQLMALAARARAAMPSRSAEGLEEAKDRDYLEALHEIDAALSALAQVVHPEEEALWPALDLFVLNARRLSLLVGLDGR